jgi:hypothetical protein
MRRDELFELLNIKEGDMIQVICEKIFCVALIKQGTVITERVLDEYNHLKNEVFENGRLR